ncbi:cupin [Aphanothece hegewaldii CCALA 016]|uniref:Cupin n=1 Tax=Aphanothece hegewaldii CCALA 016 TaxID=2107694 RepID=A0A2T1LW07_9CHRO|nr:cupin domain-containing protein [Aphanothece hegewaldii]PSF36033.1 cupin [Aphanothece hegewaldii CCALA 016]
MIRPSNFFSLPSVLPDQELFESLFFKENIRIERIISTGQTTPLGQWYDQEQVEWVILLQGEAVIFFEDGLRCKLLRGDYLLIKAHQKHRVEYTSIEPPCIWLAIHVYS